MASMRLRGRDGPWAGRTNGCSSSGRGSFSRPGSAGDPHLRRERGRARLPPPVDRRPACFRRTRQPDRQRDRGAAPGDRGIGRHAAPLPHRGEPSRAGLRDGPMGPPPGNHLHLLPGRPKQQLHGGRIRPWASLTRAALDPARRRGRGALRSTSSGPAPNRPGSACPSHRHRALELRARCSCARRDRPAAVHGSAVAARPERKERWKGDGPALLEVGGGKVTCNLIRWRVTPGTGTLPAGMRRAVALLSVLVLAGCGSRVAATSPSATPKPTVESTTLPAASAAGGAGKMVGFTGALTPAILEDWRQHQFGGLFVDPKNHNGGDAIAIRQLIQSVRGVMLHQMMAATNPEGGAGQSALATTSRGLKALGFDINLAPVADAPDVTAAIADIHAAGMYAAAKSSSDFRAVIAAHVEFVMVGHLTVPSIAVPRDLGYQGVIVSDDLEMGSLIPSDSPPAAAVRFLKNGGDMVIVSHDLAVADATYAAIHLAVLNGTYRRAQLDASVQRLLSLGLRYMP